MENKERRRVDKLKDWKWDMELFISRSPALDHQTEILDFRSSPGLAVTGHCNIWMAA